MRKELLTWTALGTASFVASWSGAAHAQAVDWNGAYFTQSYGAAVNTGATTLTFPDGVAAPATLYFSNNVPYFSGAGDGGVAYTPWPTDIPGAGGQLAITIGGGYNWQPGRIVFGVESDITLIAGAATQFSFFNTETILGETRTSELTVTGGLDTLFTVRPRIGVAVGNLMLYGTGGLALGHATFNTTASLFQDSGKFTGGDADWAGSNEAWQTGFVAGGGAEYALNNGAALRFEALYYNLGSIGATATGEGGYGLFAGTPITVSPYSGEMALAGMIIRGGVSVGF